MSMKYSNNPINIRPTHLRTLSMLSVIALGPLLLSAVPDWAQVQEIKATLLKEAAEHAMEQQKASFAEPVVIELNNCESMGENSTMESISEGRLDFEVISSPKRWNSESSGILRVSLEEPINMLAGHSGLAMTIRTQAGTSPEVRWGVRLIGQNGETAEILPTIPLLDNWGEKEHEIYLDWAFINYADVEQAIAVLESVVSLEFTTAAALRTPEYGPSREAQKALFELSELRLVDYLPGSYDPNRHSWGWDGSDKKDLTLQHRVQEVSGLVARFGEKKGLASAIASLDMAVHTQCWDGSFIETRRGAKTVVTGEYTHGFTLWGLTDAYAHLAEIEHPALEAVISIGTDTMTRRAFYQRMMYRAAMSRASHLPSKYRDDIIHSNTLIYGANRVLGYAVAMRRAADYLEDAARRDDILDRYAPIIREIAEAQGAYSGGFPILGEGDRYEGKGIHYDSGYIRTHMDWLVLGIKGTGDSLLVQMLDRYQTVIEAVMDSEGTGILPLISERGHGTASSKLVVPDATAQVGIKYNLPVMAQWGYNVGMPIWEKWEPGARINHFTWGAHARGYPLGAHINILLFDIDADPEPIDIGYRFPRQFPVWSSRFFDKETGAHLRTSRIRIDPDGTQHNDFKIEVGEFLETVGVPVSIKSPQASVTVEAVSLDGWPALLDDDAVLYLEFGDKKIKGKINHPFQVELIGKDPVKITITGPDIDMPKVAGGGFVPFRCELILTPQATAQKLKLNVRNSTPLYE